MEIRSLDLPAVRRLYDTKMKRDFPEDELRPFRSIRSLTEQGHYETFALTDGEEIAAYASFAFSEGASPALLLDYYAVDESRRGQGLGTGFLRELSARRDRWQAPFLLIEAESPESASLPEELETRRRRLRFYQGCGCVQTGIMSLLFGVEYRILALPLGDGGVPSDETVRTSLLSLYRMIVPPLVGNDEKSFAARCRVYPAEQTRTEEI